MRHLLDHRGFVHLVRNLGDTDDVAPLHLLDLRLGAHHDGATARQVRLLDRLLVVDDAPRGKIRSLHELEQLLHGRIRMIHQMHGGIDQLPQVMRRDIRGHADGDTDGAVEEEMRQLGGHHHRLLARGIVVRHEIDRVLVDVLQNLIGKPGHFGLGIAHGRGTVSVDTAEVPLPVDDGVAHREILRHAHERLVHGAVAVRVVLTQNVSDDEGALAELGGGFKAQLIHGVEDATVHGFQSVTGIRQRARDDDAHRVVQVTRLHLCDDRSRCDLADLRQLVGTENREPVDHRNGSCFGGGLFALVFFIILFGLLGLVGFLGHEKSRCLKCEVMIQIFWKEKSPLYPEIPPIAKQTKQHKFLKQKQKTKPDGKVGWEGGKPAGLPPSLG